MKIRRGMRFKNKTTGKVFHVIRKATGNHHWTVSQMKGAASHRIHEGTLKKFYEEVA